MSRIRLYVDEDAAEHAVVDGLRSYGVDVLTVFDVGRDSASDVEQLEFATSNGRALYSLNVADFCRLHKEWLTSSNDHAGVIVIPRQRYSVGEKIQRLENLVDTVSAEDMRNRLEYL